MSNFLDTMIIEVVLAIHTNQDKSRFFKLFVMHRNVDDNKLIRSTHIVYAVKVVPIRSDVERAV